MVVVINGKYLLMKIVVMDGGWLSSNVLSRDDVDNESSREW